MLCKQGKLRLCGIMPDLEVIVAWQLLYPHDGILCCTGNTFTYATCPYYITQACRHYQKGLSPYSIDTSHTALITYALTLGCSYSKSFQLAAPE